MEKNVLLAFTHNIGISISEDVCHVHMEEYITILQDNASVNLINFGQAIAA